MDRVKIFKLILWIVTGLGLSAAIARFAFGLGVTTNLSDTTPWGFWIGFDVVSGVALAAGGFVITATVYIMRKEEFHPIVKPAVLTAFLGYIAVIVGLLFDLGLPWNIWHPVVQWQHHSALFEVAWCVMLYTTVLALEFSPVPLEETSRYAKIRSFLMRYRLVFVILGIMLSTLHQSSLGSLFLIMPFKLHPLWYTPILPIMFFISAIALGLMMVTFESLFTSWLYRRKAETPLLAKLGKAAVWVIAIYALVRFIDLGARGALGYIFAGSFESIMFIVEASMVIIIPLILLSIPRTRHSLKGLWAASLLVVLGIVFNRINVAGLMMTSATGSHYVPSLSEILISASVVSAAVLAFLFAVEHFKVWERKPIDPEAKVEKLPEFDRASNTWLGRPEVAARIKYSLAFVLAVAVGLMFWPFDRLESRGIQDTPVVKARGGEKLIINGNRNFDLVLFKHKMHEDTLGGKESCVKCHHMNIPGDKESGCWQCHADMNKYTDAFRHDWHASPSGGNLGCVKCHEPDQPKMALTASECNECHKDLIPPGAAIKVEDYTAPGYVDAMHGSCVECHKEKAAALDKPKLPQCTTCHDQEVSDSINQAIAAKHEGRKSPWVTMPEIEEN
ncbi:MAG TPA: Ni/Fe-hydrogenase cytochrome b subunit [candidate division Zixibacteria bacterium]|nr:Ni/Fe-hydrogenase cytochrome b subunit [candidate division Zixibacteria bacterium]